MARRSSKLASLPGNVVWYHSVASAHAPPTSKAATIATASRSDRLMTRAPTAVRKPNIPNRKRWAKRGLEMPAGRPAALLENRDDARNSKLTAIHPAAATTPMVGNARHVKASLPLRRVGPDLAGVAAIFNPWFGVTWCCRNSAYLDESRSISIHRNQKRSARPGATQSTYRWAWATRGSTMN